MTWYEDGMYDREQINEALKKVKSINRTVEKKIQHYAKLEEIRGLLHELMDINKWVFDPEYFTSFCEYKNAINNKETKQKLDRLLDKCIRFAGKELCEILTIIDNYDWDKEKQKYIERKVG